MTPPPKLRVLASQGPAGDEAWLVNVLGLKGAQAQAPANITVGASATLLVAGNLGRAKAVIRNTDPFNSVFVGYTATITTANAPVRLAPGDILEETEAQGDLYGIRGAAAVVVAVQEVYGSGGELPTAIAVLTVTNALIAPSDSPSADALRILQDGTNRAIWVYSAIQGTWKGVQIV